MRPDWQVNSSRDGARAGVNTCPFLVLHASFQGRYRGLDCWIPAQGGNMNDVSSLRVKDWYALGSLVAQQGFLVAAVWFGRNFLGWLCVVQKPMSALRKLVI